jgi:dTDP-4-amino-4,6-dideoxygalactose transaminase
MGPDAQFLRRHVLELPIHQDLTARHVDHIATQVNSLTIGMER